MKISLLFAGALLAGCSGHSSGDFVGNWTPMSGLTTVTCGSQVMTQGLPRNDTDSWVQGSDGKIILSNEFGSLTADVDGDTANLASSTAAVWLETFPGEGVVSPVTNEPAGTFSGSVMVTSYSFQVDTESQTANETFTGNATITLDGASMPCGVTENAHFQRSQD